VFKIIDGNGSGFTHASVFLSRFYNTRCGKMCYWYTGNTSTFYDDNQIFVRFARMASRISSAVQPSRNDDSAGTDGFRTQETACAIMLAK